MRQPPSLMSALGGDALPPERCAVCQLQPRRLGLVGGRRLAVGLIAWVVLGASGYGDVARFFFVSPHGHDEIKRAFKQAVLSSHPDQSGGQVDRFTEVLAAYDFLTNSQGLSSLCHARSTTGWADPLYSDGMAPVGREVDPWQFDPVYGYGTADLEELWAEIGFSPYTGTCYRAYKRHEPVSASTAGGGAGAAYPGAQSWAAHPHVPSSCPGPEPSSQSCQASRTPTLETATLLQITGYLCLVVLSAMLAFSPQISVISGVCHRREAALSSQWCGGFWAANRGSIS